MNIVTTSEQLDAIVQHYSNVDAFCFDVETMGDHRADPRRNRVVWIALATTGRCDVIPCGHPHGNFIATEYPLLPSAVKRVEKGLPLRPHDFSRDERKATHTFTPAPEQLTPAEVFSALKPIMMNDQILKVGHNVGFDAQTISKYVGGLPVGPFFDTMVASFVLDSGVKHHIGLADCLKREFDYAMEKGVGKMVEAHGYDVVAKYAYLDAKMTWLLYKTLAARVEEQKITSALRLDMDVLEVTMAMEMSGALLDEVALGELAQRLDTEIEDARATIYATAGRAFNLNSNPAKQEILFGSKAEGGRGLKPKILTVNGKKKKNAGETPDRYDYSVAADALEEFRAKDQLAGSLLHYADLQKLQSTYVIPYAGGTVERMVGGKAKMVSKDALVVKGKIHTQFVLTGADTGRFSSRNPNLQNIPHPRTDNGKAIRNLFVAPPDHSLVVADYSQIEPRVIASLSEDPVMMDAYLNGKDIYTAIAEPLGITRDGGKVAVLSVSYGVGPDKVASSLGVTLTQAKELLDDFDQQFSVVLNYKKKVIREARARKPKPYVKTLVGRRRYLPDLLHREPGFRSRAERQAFNTVIQGSAADLIKLAMIRAHRQIPDGAHLILTVHDELVTVTPNHLVEETADAIREAMEGITALKVPLVADLKIVSKWGEAK